MVNYGELVATPNTKLLLHLNGNSTDASGNGNNGVWSGTEAYGNCVFGQGASFNGSTSKIVGATDTVYFGANPDYLSYGCRFKTSSTGADNHILSFYVVANSPGHFRLDTANKISAFLYLGGTGYSGQSTLTYNDGLWHHIIATLDKPAGKYKVYIDTSLQITINVPNNVDYTGGAALGVGAPGDGSGGTAYRFEGSIDEVIIENRAWSSTEVLNYYNQSKGVFAPKIN